MTATEFKTGIKKLKANLKGLTIQLITPQGASPFTTLKEFGQAILKVEKTSNSFCINQVWTSNGVVKVYTLPHLKELFVTETITGVSFGAHYIPETFEESIRFGYSLND